MAQASIIHLLALFTGGESGYDGYTRSLFGAKKGAKILAIAGALHRSPTYAQQSTQPDCGSNRDSSWGKGMGILIRLRSAMVWLPRCFLLAVGVDLGFLSFPAQRSKEGQSANGLSRRPCVVYLYI